MLATEGLQVPQAQDLALRILELERNLSQLRQLNAGKAVAPEATGWLGRLNDQRNQNVPVHAARYLKRAYNQLVKAMRAL